MTVSEPGVSVKQYHQYTDPTISAVMSLHKSLMDESRVSCFQ